MMETVSILQGGHKRGIGTVAFSADGEVNKSHTFFGRNNLLFVLETGFNDYHCVTV